MIETGQKWELFGYDTRQVGRHWTAAWRDLLLGYDSPVRRRLDDVVSLRTESGSACYQAGKECHEQVTDCNAVLLKSELVLSKELRLPLAVESELDAVLRLEVNANSPFPSADTGYGWRVVSRDDSHVRVQLAIVSLSSVMAYLGRQYNCHDALAQEVWAKVDGDMVVISGFGEGLRETRYKKRIIRSAVMLCSAAALVVLGVGVAAGFKGLEARHVTQLMQVSTSGAAEASRMRDDLVAANDSISAANKVMENYPNPHAELARLTRLLGDSAALTDFSMTGNEVRVRGVAQDAAAIMELLTDEAAYTQVSAPQAITRVGGSSQLEVFHLNISLQEDGAPE